MSIITSFIWCYLLTLSDVAVGSSVLQVTATDVDLYPPLLKYTLQSSSPSNGSFSIDPFSGIVYTSTPLNYSLTTTYQLIVMVGVHILLDIFNTSLETYLFIFTVRVPEAQLTINEKCRFYLTRCYQNDYLICFIFWCTTVILDLFPLQLNVVGYVCKSRMIFGTEFLLYRRG